MYLVISHFTQNKWTTDYFLDYLENKQEKYYYLRHPFNFEQDLSYSELIYFDGKNKQTVWKYKKSNIFLLDIIRNIFLSFYIWIKLSFKIDKIVWFWWFNIFPFLYLRLFWKKTYFWGVDYSKKRFENKFFNWLYGAFETISCKFSNMIISSSERQKEARTRFHGATKKKSLVINNGVENTDFPKDFSRFPEIGFFYLGSITKQHGVIDFIKYFYIKNDINIPLYIIGWGEEENHLKNIIETNNLSRVVQFLGRKNQDEISDFLQNQEKKLFWIAPYSDIVNDHVYYIDSLKVREYLAYNMPFIISDISYIDCDLKEFWIIYKKFKDIDLQKLETFSFDIEKKNSILEKYTWYNLFSKEF